jgi:NAD(P)-dependent dehydrogenase (short-subunit alcohol dehydrogenase family)
MRPRPRFRTVEYKTAARLKGRRALITGGDSGIGRAVAVLFAREGADVAIVHLPEEMEDGRETAAAVEAAGRRCIRLTGDVRSPEFCAEAVEETVRQLGGLDILVNNAAFQQRQDDLTASSLEQWNRCFQTSIHAYFYMARAALPYLKAGAAIRNSGSSTGIDGSEVLIDYSATKGAIHTFTKSLARNLVHREIRVNCIAPGPVGTPLNVVDKPAFVFFASTADSSYITGEVLLLLGGDTVGA